MRIGVAQRDLAPAPGLELSGFAMRVQPSDGMLDPLLVRVLYLEDGAERLLWLHLDLLAVQEALVSRIRTWALDRFGLAARQVVVTATHTHSAPAALPLRNAGRMDRDFVVRVEQLMKEAAAQAFAGPESCLLVEGEGRLDLAVHRGGPATVALDPGLGVLGFRRGDGTFAAVVANYAVHPVALGHQNRSISGDLHGRAASQLSSGLPGNPMVLFTNGACGNLNPPGENVSPSTLDTWAGRMAAEAKEALQRGELVPDGTLTSCSESVRLPIETLDQSGIERFLRTTLATIPDVGFGRLVRASVHAWADDMARVSRSPMSVPDDEIELHHIRLGGRHWFGVNAEVHASFGEMLRQDGGTAKISILGYANGNLGYLCPRAAYDEGGYEVDMAHIFYGRFRFAAGALESLAAVARERMQEYPPANPVREASR